MTREELFEAWAPAEGLWSPWVKPVLFACMEEDFIPQDAGQPLSCFEVDGIPAADQNTALVLDLPGADAVWMALTLASQGYSPVPLYNAVPGPQTMVFNPLGARPISIVDVHPILVALQIAGAQLLNLDLGLDAPPAFLLDANRRGAGQFVSPGRFDNRSISFTTDFPSSTFLLAHGIQCAVVVHASMDLPQPDLAHTLRRWQDSGITIALKFIRVPGAPVPIVVQKPSAFGLLWQRALEMVGLRRHGLGGFGGVVPIPSAG